VGNEACDKSEHDKETVNECESLLKTEKLKMLRFLNSKEIWGREGREGRNGS